MALRRLKDFAFLLVGEALLNVILCVCLIQYFGLAGVALGIMIPTILFQGILQPAVLCRFLHVSAATYLSQVYFRPLMVERIEAYRKNVRVA